MTRLGVMRIVAARTEQSRRLVVRRRPIHVVGFAGCMTIQTIATRRKTNILLEEDILHMNAPRTVTRLAFRMMPGHGLMTMTRAALFRPERRPGPHHLLRALVSLSGAGGPELRTGDEHKN